MAVADDYYSNPLDLLAHSTFLSGSAYVNILQYRAWWVARRMLPNVYAACRLLVGQQGFKPAVVKLKVLVLEGFKCGHTIAVHCLMLRCTVSSNFCSI